jgi:predicted Na+-dependent transporter
VLAACTWAVFQPAAFAWFGDREIVVGLAVIMFGMGLTIALVCGSVIGRNAAEVRTSGPRLLAAVVLLHGAGFAIGHAFARLAAPAVNPVHFRGPGREVAICGRFTK